MKRFFSIITIFFIVSELLVGCKVVKFNKAENDIVITKEDKNDNFNRKSEQDKGVEITLWRQESPQFGNIWYKQRVEDFNKENKGKIYIKMETIPRGYSFAYEDKINIAAASEGLPDILALDGPYISNFAFSNRIIPLDKYFDREELLDFVPSIIKQGTYNGRLYALGIYESTVVLFYNKKFLEKEGIKPPTKLEDAWTWEEFYKVSKKLTKDGVYGTNLIYDKGEWMTYCFQQFWKSNNTDIISEDGTSVEGYLNGAKGVEAAMFIQKMAREGLFNVKPTPTEFEEGKSATKLGGVWNIPTFKNYPDLDWGITYFPYNLTKTSPSGGWALTISANSDHPAEAAEVIRFLTNRESSISYSKTNNTLPIRNSEYNSIPEYNEFPLKILKEQGTQTSSMRPRTPIYPILTKKFGEAINNIMLGSDVKKSLDDTVKSINEECEEYYSKSK